MNTASIVAAGTPRSAAWLTNRSFCARRTLDFFLRIAYPRVSASGPLNPPRATAADMMSSWYTKIPYVFSRYGSSSGCR